MYLKDLMRSDKFRVEPYVNVVDIINWVDQVKTGASDASNEGWREGVAKALARQEEIAAAKREQQWLAAENV